MNVVFTPTAWEQYTEWQREDRKIVKRKTLETYTSVRSSVFKDF